MTAVLLGGLAALAVLRLVVRRPMPRRDPSVRALEAPLPRVVGAGGRRRSRRTPRRRPDRAGGSARGPTRPPADLVACIDLLGVAATSGQGVGDAVRSVGAVGRGPLAAELASVGRAVDRGGSLSVGLEELARRLGPEVRPLVSALQVALSSGDGAAPALQRLADSERRRERRRRETRLRRLPVLLTVPLVLFVLPAFVVLTLVPVALSVAGDLPGLAAPSPHPHLERQP